MNFVGLEKSFGEFKFENVIRFNNPEQFFELQSKCNKSYYEILPSIIKPFFDIENVENETDVFTLIDAIKDEFKKCFNYNLKDYILTKNEHSSNHNGLSYHLIILNCKIDMNLLRRFVKNELNNYKIVDPLIYTKNRLFRTINSYGLTKDNNKDMASIHILYKHVIDDISIEFTNISKNESLISNISNIENELKLNLNVEKEWNLIEVCKTSKRKHPIRITTYSQNSINLSNIEIVDGNIIIPLSKKTDKKQTVESYEKELYDKIIVLLEFETSITAKNKLLDMKKYYEHHNSFKNYKLELNQIRYMIELIEGFISSPLKL